MLRWDTPQFLVICISLTPFCFHLPTNVLHNVHNIAPVKNYWNCSLVGSNEKVKEGNQDEAKETNIRNKLKIMG